MKETDTPTIDVPSPAETTEAASPPPAVIPADPAEATAELPRRYPAEVHGITPEKLDPDAVKVVRRLREHGHETYIVGGAIRDLLIGRTPKDFDVATAAPPEVVRRLFRNSRIIGRRFQIVHVYFRGPAGRKVIEVSTFRRAPDEQEQVEVEQASNEWGTAEDDARRRDLTINAFFFDPERLEVLDWVGGLPDLERGIVRIIGPPELRFREDPVRMIRAIRHAARAGFLIDAETWRAIQASAPLIRACNESRVRQEFIREFQEGAASRSLKLLHRAGLLAHLLPELDVFLTGLHSRPRQKRVYWKLLALLDREGLAQELPRTLIMAAAMGPAIVPELLGVFPQGSKLALEPILRDLQPFARATGLQRGLLEPLAQALYAQPRLDQARKAGHIPKRLRSKSYFPLALHLFVLRHRAIGSQVPEGWLELLPTQLSETTPADEGGTAGGEETETEAARPTKRRRRRQRRKRGQGQRDGG